MLQLCVFYGQQDFVEAQFPVKGYCIDDDNIVDNDGDGDDYCYSWECSADNRTLSKLSFLSSAVVLMMIIILLIMIVMVMMYATAVSVLWTTGLCQSSVLCPAQLY